MFLLLCLLSILAAKFVNASSVASDTHSQPAFPHIEDQLGWKTFRWSPGGTGSLTRAVESLKFLSNFDLRCTKRKSTVDLGGLHNNFDLTTDMAFGLQGPVIIVFPVKEDNFYEYFTGDCWAEATFKARCHKKGLEPFNGPLAMKLDVTDDFFRGSIWRNKKIEWLFNDKMYRPYPRNVHPFVKNDYTGHAVEQTLPYPYGGFILQEFVPNAMSFLVLILNQDKKGAWENTTTFRPLARMFLLALTVMIRHLDEGIAGDFTLSNIHFSNAKLPDNLLDLQVTDVKLLDPVLDPVLAQRYADADEVVESVVKVLIELLKYHAKGSYSDDDSSSEDSESERSKPSFHCELLRMLKSKKKEYFDAVKGASPPDEYEELFFCGEVCKLREQLAEVISLCNVVREFYNSDKALLFGVPTCGAFRKPEDKGLLQKLHKRNPKVKAFILPPEYAPSQSRSQSPGSKRELPDPSPLLGALRRRTKAKRN